MKAVIPIVLNLAFITPAIADSRISEPSTNPLLLLVASLIIALLVFTQKPRRIAQLAFAVLGAALTYTVLYICTMLIILPMNFIGLTTLFDLAVTMFFNTISVQIAFWTLVSLPVYLLLEYTNKNTTTTLLLIGFAIPVAILSLISNSLTHQSSRLKGQYKGIERALIDDGSFTLWGWLGFFEIAIVLGCSGALTAILFRTIASK